MCVFYETRKKTSSSLLMMNNCRTKRCIVFFLKKQFMFVEVIKKNKAFKKAFVLETVRVDELL